jgi:DNA-binding PadR family transcriptional regulator
MALSHAILATVLNEPMTGYDLAKRFSKRSGYIWRATHQQIYQELAKLEVAGLLKGVDEGGEQRTDRVPRSITPAGRGHLLEWVVRSNEPASIKDEILVKCLTLGLASAKQVSGPIADRRAQHHERLTHYRSTVEEKYGDPRTLSGEALGHYLALAGGIRYETAWIAWADEALELLKRF